MPEFTVKIVERPAVKTAGLKIHTTMEKASADCMKLWSETFMPHMESFPCDGSGESFGVSIMTSETEFDYWAVMPLGANAKIPAGMTELAIPAGTYAECPVQSLEEMPKVYCHLYNTEAPGSWPATQKDYAINFRGVGFELYNTKEFMTNGSFLIYAPVTKK